MTSPSSVFRVLPLAVVDFAAAALLYRLVGPSLGALPAIVGVLLLASVAYRLSGRTGPDRTSA